ncbi:MAG: Stk1 family PASTA domain-containing Ser/Thr kinase [Clostridiaceae bacterium]|nr:Stk1 family PASTA domain-containing Ser/Thr kinase [Clostridiaceae bacterium]
MVGTVLGNRYSILSEIGSGGMARVYKAQDRYLQRHVAVKILKDEFKHDADFLKRFEKEAQAAASLTHPNIVQIYDVGTDNGNYYIVMELVEGITLKEYIKKVGALDWKEAVSITIQICSALSKAHSRGIVHRDIKPQNILITSDGIPKVTDFGIARAASADTATMKLDTIGSVHYSSPEQVRGGYIDEKSDIYSIGVTFFEMVTGRLPFDGESSVSVALKHIQDIPPLPTDVKPGIPSALNTIVMKAMAKSRKDRYQSASELIQDLENLTGKPSDATEILLPNVKHDRSRYDTRKLEVLEDDDLARKNRKPSRRGHNRTMRVVLPFLYVVLILVIAGGIYLFISAIVNEFRQEVSQPEAVTVGKYVNRNINEVIAELEEKGIKPYDIVYRSSDTVEKDIVMDQSIPPGNSIKAGSIYTTLVLTVSQGADMVTIPPVEMQEHTGVYYLLKDEYGLDVEERSEYSEEVPINMVIRTEPKANTQVKKGDKVIIYWSLGPKKETVVVPGVIGKTYDEAVAILTQSKLKIGRTYPEGREGFQGKIIDQFPKEGDQVLEDTAVDLTFEDDSVPTPPGEEPSYGTRPVTIVIPLPPGIEEDTVGVRVVKIDNATNEETVLVDNARLRTSEFPHNFVVNIPEKGGCTIRAYVNNILVTEKIY